MKKIVSLALFGDGDKYSKYISAYVRGHLNLFPIEEGWRLRVHYDDAIMKVPAGRLLRHLSWNGLIEISYKGEAPPLTKAMLWRLEPIFDDEISHVFCRDIDAPPMPRDRAVCDEFVLSGASMGTCHDNVMHIGVMGGLCHFQTTHFKLATGFNKIDDVFKYASGRQWTRHGVDQDVLNSIARDRPGLVLLEHRFAGWTQGQQGHTTRSAGLYECIAYSKPTPDIGKSNLPSEAQIMADQLGAHLGCAHYDNEQARIFWDEHGSQDIRRRIEVAEREAEQEA